MDEKLRKLQQQLLLTGDPEDEYTYRKAAVDAGQDAIAGIKVGDVLRVDESSQEFNSWIETPSPWVGVLVEIHKQDLTVPQSWVKDGDLMVAPLHEAEPTNFAYEDWGVQVIFSLNTVLVVKPKEVRVKRPSPPFLSLEYKPWELKQTPKNYIIKDQKCLSCGLLIAKVNVYPTSDYVCPYCDAIVT